MSTTHPTNITTEWDDLQRKHGNLPKLEPEETNEVRDAKLVEVAEHELLREARLREWKRRMQAKAQPTFGVPVTITEDNFVTEVTNASKAAGATKDDVGEESASFAQNEAGSDEDSPYVESRPELLKTAGQYIPVLLLDDRKEAIYLKDAWRELARRHPTVKFTMAPVNKIIKCDNKNSTPPSSVLLYFGGKCIMQKHAMSVLQLRSYEISESSVESRIANVLEALLNSASSHGPFLCGRQADANSDSDSDSEDDDSGLRSAGKAFQRDFLSKISGQRARRDSDSESDVDVNSKTYTSWVFDRALKR
ncbi:hypothetical protein BgAZ_302360 [Babesia gibsoni]|uniref:Phosducin thioredoxin-like domain-containing protein n=1 Tax=Babesia gibsoni TaxID=33632 RepID=A0AAD8LNJ3_BABGI|nr:hypothetical protein BgAZ_302360 [Babesia gibsoni]